MGYPPRPGLGTPDLGWGTPLDLGRGTPPLHSEHLIRDERYASYVHAGGLSCIKSYFYFGITDVCAKYDFSNYFHGRITQVFLVLFQCGSEPVPDD